MLEAISSLVHPMIPTFLEAGWNEIFPLSSLEHSELEPKTIDLDILTVPYSSSESSRKLNTVAPITTYLDEHGNPIEDNVEESDA